MTRAKQDMERQRYNNYDKMQNSECISSPVVLYGCESWTIRKAKRRTDSDSEALYLAHWPYKINTYRCMVDSHEMSTFECHRG